jgi:hypothetical protein
VAATRAAAPPGHSHCVKRLNAIDMAEKKKRKNLASREKKKSLGLGASRSDQKSRRNQAKFGVPSRICRVENLKQQGYLLRLKKTIHK